MKQVLTIALIILLIPVVVFVFLLIYGTITDYKPKPVELIGTSQGKVVNINDTLTVFDWNIGYAGLDSSMSFFYDGGEKVRTTKAKTIENLQGIINEIAAYDSVDFYLLQEVDLLARRSYKINIYQKIQDTLPQYFTSFAYNYKVNFIPSPLTNPLGKVQSGLASFSKYQPFAIYRHAFLGNYSWPKGMFLLDRCFKVQHFYTSNGKELLIINTHNSAYDDGSLRKKQMKMMREFLLTEYEKGNYIVVGGDWNQMPPNADKNKQEYKDKHLTRIRVPFELMPKGWQWVFNEDIPTNRMINEPYNPETTITSTIDFFLISPNIKAGTLKNIDRQFEFSDHQPVIFSFGFVH